MCKFSYSYHVSQIIKRYFAVYKEYNVPYVAETVKYTISVETSGLILLNLKITQNRWRLYM